MTHMRRTWWQLLATLVAFTLVATACGSGDSNGGEAATGSTVPPGLIGGSDDDTGQDTGEGPQYGGRISVALEAETANWLPGVGQFVIPSGTSVAHAIYDPLIILDHEDQPQPYLAESLEPNSDLTEWTLKLRSGVRFHDGSELNAEVLKWNFDTLHNIPTSNTFGAINSAGITDLEVVDRLTVVYHLSEPNAAFPDSLRGSLGWPTSQKAYEELGEDLGEQPVGTGPFMFEQWTRDDRFVVVRNPNYWRTDDDGNKLPYLDAIEFRPLPDEDSRYQSLAADSVQVMVTKRGSTASQVLQLVEEREYLANLSIGNESGASIFNITRPPVDDIRVRSALILMSDGHDVARILGDDALGVPRTDSFFAPESGWYSEVAGQAYLAREGTDPDRATALIEEYVNDPNRSDGKAVGEPVQVEYACPPDPSLIEIGQYYQSQWGSIGVDVQLRQVEQAQLVNNAITGDYMISCWRAGAGAGDPLAQLSSFFSDPETNPLNFTNFHHPEIDEAIERLRTNLDFQIRYEAVETIGRIANENAIMTWSIATPSVVGFRDDVVGLTDWVLPDGTPGNGTPGGHMHFSQVYLRR